MFKIGVTLLLLLSQVDFIASVTNCSVDLDCNRPSTYLKCAYCNSKRTCGIIDSSVFRDLFDLKPFYPCDFREFHCTKNDYCFNSERKPEEGYGECLCFCQDSMSGKQCKTRGERGYKYPSAIQFIPPIHIEFNTPASLLISIGRGPTTRSELSRLSLIVHDTLGGYLGRVTDLRALPTSNEIRSYCVNLVRSLKYLRLDTCNYINGRVTELLYTGSFVIPFDWTTPPGENVTSFIRQIQLNTYWDRVLMSQHKQHYYHLNYPRVFESIPIVSFTGCGQNLESIKIYEFKDTIHLSADILYADASEFKRAKRAELEIIEVLNFKWEAYRVFDEKTEVTDFRIGSLSWDIPSFDWSGMYLINLTVSGYFKHWLPPAEIAKESNFNICLLEVVYSPLIAIISGGSARFVYKEHGLILDASKSINPNSPDRNSGMRFIFTCNWTEEAVCLPYTTDSRNYEPYKIKANMLQSYKVYNFTLKVTSYEINGISPDFVSQIISVGSIIGEAETFLKDILIICVYNCDTKSNPNDIVYLRVGGHWRLLKSLVFEWTKFEVGEEGIKIDSTPSVESIRQSNTPSYIFIIKEDKLKENFTYLFKVSYKNSSQFAVYPINIASSISPTCKITPDSGVMGLTNFRLSCTLCSFAKTFEFYDKNETDEPDFSGRMVAFQETCTIEQFVLTRGKLEIQSFYDFGLMKTITLNVELSQGSSTIADIELILDNMIKLAETRSVDESLETASIIPDLLAKITNSEKSSKTNILQNVVKFLSTLSIQRYKDAKLGISTIHNVLLAINESLSLNSALYAVRTVYSLTHVLALGQMEGQSCTFRVLYQIARRILDCLFIVLKTGEKLVGNDALSVRYTNPVFYMTIKEITQYLMKSLWLLQSTLSHRHLPAQEYKLIKSNLGTLSLWIKVDLPMALSKYSQEEYVKNMFPVIISDKLAGYVESLGFYLALQFASFKGGPTWLAKINTREALEVSVCFKENESNYCKHTKVLKHAIKAALSVSDLIVNVRSINITLKQLDALQMNSTELELELPIYKLDPLPLAQVDAQFKFFSNNTEVTVFVGKGVRPTYEILMKYGSKVTHKNPNYQVVTDPLNSQQLYYFAIQPGAQVEVNNTISFELKIFSKICYTWHNKWETRGCRTTTDLVTGALICECNRLSVIGGFVTDVLCILDTVEVLPLFFSVRTYKTTFLSLIFLIFTIILLAIICRKADRYDRTKRFVSILPDNFPGEKFGYLVCVVTGFRVGAGTDAAVGIRIYGSLNDSRSHILSNDTHNVMDGIGEDWFLIYEPDTLGRILTLDLWHDSTGADTDWFCESVLIYDLFHKDCYYFLVSDWLTLKYKRFPYVTIYPSFLSEVTSPPKTFLDYLKSGFQTSHIWLDLIVKHPRDPVSRVDRLAVVLCFICISMATSGAIITHLDNHKEEDDFSYSVTWIMLEVSIYTCVAAASVACLLMYMFRGIYKIIFYVEKRVIKSTHETKVTRVSLQEDYLATPSTTSLQDDKAYIHYGRRHQYLRKARKRTIAETINLFLMPKQLVPVQIKGDDPNVVIRTSWLVCTWITVISILILCIFHILFAIQELPLIKTKEWFTVVVLSVFIHFFIFLPLKLVLVSALLAIAFKRIIHKDVYTFDPKDGLQSKKYGNIRYLANLVYLRSQIEYHPLYESFRENQRQKRIKTEKWSRLYQLLVQMMFIMVLISLIGTQIPIRFHTNTHLQSLMKDYNKVFNTTDYVNYLKHYCSPRLFKYIWYNWKIISQGSEQNFFRRDWMYDGINRMLGKVYLRQFRVKKGNCKVPFNHSIDCAAPYSRSAEDTRDYIPFWIREEDSVKTNEILGIDILNKWSYKKPSDDSNFYYGGRTGQIYHRGGYTWDLGASGEEMDASSVRLWEEGWIDHYTRAVLAQVKVYNINTRLFSELVLVSEQTVAGQILPTILVNSLDINVQLNWGLTLFIFFSVMLCLRVIVLTNFVGVMGLFKKWRQFYELLVTVIALLVLLYLLLHFFTVPQYVGDYQLHSEELNFFDFYKVAHYLFTASSLLTVLYVLTLIRFFSLWRFGTNLYRFFLTFSLSIKYFIWLFGLFVLFQFIFFRAVGYLFLLFIDTVFNANMIYKLDCSYYLSVTKATNNFNILCYIISFNSVLTMALLICIFTHNYKTSRKELIRDLQVDNHFRFFQDEVKIMLKQRVVPRTTRFLPQTLVGKHEAKKDMLRMRSVAALK